MFSRRGERQNAGRVVVPLRARVLCGPQNTLAHVAGGRRKCLTGSWFRTKMGLVGMDAIPPGSSP